MEIPKPDTHTIRQLDCSCGAKYHIIDLTRSKIMRPYELRRMKKGAKQMGRSFIQSPDGIFACSKCRANFDLASKPDEEWKLDSEGKFERIA